MLSPPRRNRPISFLFKLLGATIFLSISLFFFSHSHVSRFHHEIDAPNDLFEYLFSATSQFLKAASSGADDHHPQDSTGDNPWQPVFLINNTLTKEGAIKASIAPDGHSKVPVLVTVANNQYRAMLMNWIKHIQEIKYHNVLIGMFASFCMYAVGKTFSAVFLSRNSSRSSSSSNDSFYQ